MTKSMKDRMESVLAYRYAKYGLDIIDLYMDFIRNSDTCHILE
jgi:hypothetical protein